MWNHPTWDHSYAHVIVPQPHPARGGFELTKRPRARAAERMIDKNAKSRRHASVRQCSEEGDTIRWHWSCPLTFTKHNAERRMER